MNRLLIMGTAALAFSVASAQAQNMLVNGFLDIPPADFPGWTLSETVTGMPGTPVNSAQQQDFANHDAGGVTGMWLRAFGGNTDNLVNQNKAINAVLRQSVAGIAGETYTFSGWSRWETNYSGGVATLDPTSPSGAIVSPTNTTMELAFLNGANAVIGAPVTLDLRTQQMNDGMWRQHTLMGLAPAGTASVRVTASATDMLFNKDPGQSAFYDEFSLRGAGAPATELLTNGFLNDVPPVPGWTLIENGGNTAEIQGFADHPGDPGQLGLWLRPFVSSTQNPLVGATLTQTVPTAPGASLKLSAWSRWEANYSGGQTGTPTQTLLQMEFLNAGNAVIGAPITLDLRTQQMNDNTWRQHMLSGIAPAGTASVRISAIANNMFSTTGAQSAFFDDFALVPEPASLSLGMLALVGLCVASRRR